MELNDPRFPPYADADDGSLVRGVSPRVKPRARLLPHRRCGEAGCRQPTADGKPFCIDHLDRLPYVKTLQRQLSRSQEELLAAYRENGWKQLDPRGVQAQEIIDQVAALGVLTPDRLARAVGMKWKAVANYLVALERAGLVKRLTLRSRRGGVRRVVTLPMTRATESAARASLVSARR